MSDKIRLEVEVYTAQVEFHEIILTKEEHEKIKDWNKGEHITDYISEKTLMFTEESNWDYDIVKEGEVNELEKTTTA